MLAGTTLTPTPTPLLDFSQVLPKLEYCTSFFKKEGKISHSQFVYNLDLQIDVKFPKHTFPMEPIALQYNALFFWIAEDSITFDC